MICIPLKKKSVSELVKAVKKAENISDLIEVWFDELRELRENLREAELQKIFKNRKKPIIYKTQIFSPLSRISQILNHHPEFIDLDFKTDPKTINFIKKQFPKTKIILSYHNFKETPSTKILKNIAQKMIKNKADIIKLATHANNLRDSIRMLVLLKELSRKTKAVCLCMGKYGKLTRTAGHLFGNYLMYAPLALKDKTADGQITAKELREIQTLIPKLCR